MLQLFLTIITLIIVASDRQDVYGMPRSYLFEKIDVKMTRVSLTPSNHIDVAEGNENVSSKVSSILPDSNIKKVNVDDNDLICNTPACVDAASFILKNMNSSVNPCENFYQFTCGNFINETVIPDGENQVNIFSMTKNKVEDQLLQIVSDKVKDNDPAVLKLIKTYYKTCMNTDQIEKNSKKDLQEILKNIGGCPVLEGQTWDEINFDWKRSVYEANKIGYDSNFFISTSVSVDPNNSTRHIIIIDQAVTVLPKEYLAIDEVIRVLLKMMTDIAKFFGTNRKQAKKELRDSLNFQITLADISLSEQERRDQSKLNNRMTLNQLETNYDFLPWTEYVNEILAPYAKVDRNEEVVVAVPSFLEKFSKLIAKTPKRVLANYACMNMITNSIGNMGKRMLKIEAKSREVLSGITKPQPRSTICLTSLTKHLVTAVGWLYGSFYVDNDAKINAVELTTDVREILYHLIKKASWMDEATKLAALEKLRSVVAYVGYPDELGNVGFVNEFYHNAKLSPESYLKSELNMMKFMKGVLYSSLRKPVNYMQWVDHSNIAQVNAQYYPTVNSFDLLAGILQGHFYNKSRPSYLNYGAIGSIIGHEMSHAFDTQGSQYDKNGNLVNWWKNETKEEYLRKSYCIIEQYGSYTVKEANRTIDGVVTQGENIADNVGLKAAYLAYDKWAHEIEKEPRLPGLNYTSKQMFWISFANTYCAKYRPGALPDIMLSASHTVEEFRVIGSVSNMPQFSEDFKCPLGSPMNPVDKCSIW